jgi:CBS domain-containing protein
MRIARFVRAKDAHVGPGDTLHIAAARMRTSGLSSLPVVAGGTVVALITERDLVKAMAISDRPCEARVFDYMRNGSVSVRPDDEASIALLKMLAIGCLDLPVAIDNRLIGTVSARELLAVQAHVYGVAV